MTAALHQQDSVIKILLKSGANITAVNNEDHTALHLASTKPNTNSLKVIITTAFGVWES